MVQTGLGENLETFEKLEKAYSESHRHYHNSRHVIACLKHLDDTSHLVDKPEHIELALWFHDAIYSPYSSTNEKESAEWAKEFLQQNKVARKLIEKIYRLIMATLHQHQPVIDDEKLLVDIDLSILGSNLQVYNQFEENVRMEYRFVPKIIYRRKRKEILKSFLERERIYSTDFFYSSLELNARRNLEKTIKYL